MKGFMSGDPENSYRLRAAMFERAGGRGSLYWQKAQWLRCRPNCVRFEKSSLRSPAQEFPFYTYV